MIEIGGVFVDKKILTEYFMCDLEECNGDCCTFPGLYGAPLTDKEVPILEEQVDVVKELLSEHSLNWIKKNGTSEYTSGKPTTVCINKRDCVFVYYEGDVALCAIEKMYFAEKTEFRKPISCWLFPIRVAFHKNNLYLYYEKISECKMAIINGKHKKTKIYQVLREPLIAFMGEQWYSKLEQYAASEKLND